MEKNKDYLEKVIQKLQEEEDQNNFKDWNENLFSKFILLFPILVFVITYLIINNDKSVSDLLNFLLFSFLLVFFGVILNFLLTKK